MSLPIRASAVRGRLTTWQGLLVTRLLLVLLLLLRLRRVPELRLLLLLLELLLLLLLLLLELLLNILPSVQASIGDVPPEAPF